MLDIKQTHEDLALVAKEIGLNFHSFTDLNNGVWFYKEKPKKGTSGLGIWMPLTNDGDSFRLINKFKLSIERSIYELDIIIRVKGKKVSLCTRIDRMTPTQQDAYLKIEIFNAVVKLLKSRK